MTLLLRILRGSGPGGALRAVLVVLGVAVAVACGTTVAALPGVLGAREDAVAARMPELAADTGEPAFYFTDSSGLWDGNRFGRTYIADARPGAPAPPGVDRLPGPGELVVSPALAERLTTDPLLREAVPGAIVGTVTDDGLLGPGEWFAYIGVPRDAMPDAHAATGWGAISGHNLTLQQDGLTETLAILLVPPIALYLLVCTRLAAATRLRRYAALRLLGVRRSTVLRLAAAESGVLALLGTVLGLGAYAAVHPALAASGALGFTWFPAAAGLGPAVITLVAMTTVVLAAGLGALGLRRALDRPVTARTDVAEPRARWWQPVPLGVGLVLIAAALWNVPPPTPGVRIGMSDIGAVQAIAGITIAVAGTLLALRPITALLARRLSHDRLPYPVRLAGQRLAVAPAAGLRLSAGLVLLVLVAGIGAGVMADLKERAAPEIDEYLVSVYAGEIRGPAERREVAELPATAAWTEQNSIVETPGPGAGPPNDPAARVRFFGVRMLTITCGELRDVTGAAVPGCVDGHTYQLLAQGMAGTEFQFPAGLPVRYATADGTVTEVAVPDETLVLPAGTLFTPAASGMLLTTADEPATGWNEDLRVSALVPGRYSALEEYKASVAVIAPTARLDIPGEDLAAIEMYRNQSGVLTFGIAVGFALAAAAFAVSTVDRSVERRRDVSTLVVLGMRTRAIRLTQIVQLVAPTAAALLVAALIGFLAGTTAYRLNDVHRPWPPAVLSAMLPLLAVAAAATLAAGAVLIGRRLRTEDLRRE